MSEEKSLDKCTVKELREIAQEIEGLQGISSMKKDELINAVREARGIPAKERADKTVHTIPDVKKKIRVLKDEKQAMREQGNRLALKRLRRKISRLKKKSRNLAGRGS